ncbi:MAG: enoyl-CoA hydratase/isomerase family protein [Parvularculaceae bacterium]|nr:MAG: enoyl-CoA hydratase/isomerase family protein [Parvularculaceae bacterium]
MTLPTELDDILLARRKSILTVTLNRPEMKNALNGAMVEGLTRLADALLQTHEVRAVVLRGAGGAFCAGGDIKEFAKQMMAPDPAPGTDDPVRRGNRAFGTLLQKLDALPQVLVSVVDGPAFGGAMGLLSVSDMVIASRDAKFSLSETTLGIPPAQIGPFVVRKIGLFNARRLALTGARFDANIALGVGLVDEIADDGNINTSLTEVLNAIGRCESGAVAATKRLLNRAAASIGSDQLDQAATDFVTCLRGAGRQGAAAFAGKQMPPWVETYESEVDA